MDHNFYSHHQQKSKPEPNPKAGYTLFKWGANSGIALLKLLIVVSIISSTAFGQTTRTITGKVHDEVAAPIPGATITEKGKKNATVADVNGKFTIRVASNATLVVSIIGYVSTEITVKDETTVDVELKAQENSLNEVVVTALGIKREKKELTYSTQQVTGDQLTASKDAGVANSLDGKVSGVSITTSTGAPGSSTAIVIRGNTSLTGNNQALIVLDGVPISNSETGGSVGTNGGSGGGSSRLEDIDPSTIESVNVLKGSAASALYGSSAARGVIIITTKSGAANTKPSVTLNSQYSFENPILPHLNSIYSLGDRGAYADGSTTQQTSAIWGPSIASLQASGVNVYDHNPLTQFFTTGTTYTNTASVKGGTENTGYFLSFSNLKQDGTVPTTSYNRNTFFAKFTNKITDKITANFQINYSSSTIHSIPQGYDVNDPLWTLFTAPYTYNLEPGLDANGNQRVFRASRNNPYWSLYNDYNNEKIARIIPTFTLTYNPVKWITVTERFGVDTYSEQNDYFETPSVPLATVGQVSQNSSNFHSYNNDLIIEGRKKFKDFDVSLLLGNNVSDNYSQSHNLTGTGTTILGFDNVSNGSTLTGSESYSETRKIGFYGQSNIDYKGFLNLALTGRYDGSSVLALSHDFYPYGSVSLGFLFADMLKIPAIDFAKLRVSYSAVGNDNVGAYANNTTFGKAGSFPYNGVTGFLEGSGLGNPLLRNENTSESEVGLEFNLLKNRISFEGSYFYRNGTNLLTSVTLAPSTGYSGTSLNAASMTNKGFEALLKLSPFKGSKFGYDITFNWTKIYNKVTKINTGLSSLSNGQTYLIVGHPYGVIYDPGYVRNASGQILIDNAGLPLVSAQSEQIGNIQPNYQAGMTNNFRYGNFTLAFFLDFKNGGDILNSDERYGDFYGSTKASTANNRADFVVPGIVQSTGLPNTTVVHTEDYYQRLNLIYEASVQDATFLKLRYASIGYNVPKNYLTRTPFSNLSLTITGRNLFIYKPYFTGSDPEVSSYGTGNTSQGTYGSTVPTSRSFNFAVNVTFK